MKKVNPAVYAKRKWFSGCVEWNTVLGHLIIHIIILAPALP